VIGYLYLESQSQYAKIVKQLDLDPLKLEFNVKSEITNTVHSCWIPTWWSNFNSKFFS